MPNEALILLQNLTKTYSLAGVTREVLKDLNLRIEKGELLAIVGASGSGKSTLMNIIGLLDKPSQGHYVLKGQEVSGLNDDSLARLRNNYLGFVFQQFNLLGRLSAKQNIALPLLYRQIPVKEREERVLESLAWVGMQGFSEHKPNQLSGGQQQRIAIARALVTEPELILADEPTGSLDSRTGKEIMNLFLSLHAKGKSLIIVTHDEDIALQCHRRLSLVDGEIMADLSS